MIHPDFERRAVFEGHGRVCEDEEALLLRLDAIVARLGEIEAKKAGGVRRCLKSGLDGCARAGGNIRHAGGAHRDAHLLYGRVVLVDHLSGDHDIGAGQRGKRKQGQSDESQRSSSPHPQTSILIRAAADRWERLLTE